MHELPETLMEAFDPLGGFELAGRFVADPWMGLEASSGRLNQWLDRESDAAKNLLQAAPQFELIELLIAGHRKSRPDGHRVTIAGHRFWLDDRRTGRPRRLLVTDADAGGSARVVFDPMSHLDKRGRPQIVSWFVPSPDGNYVAIGTCSDGSEVASIQLTSLDSGGCVEQLVAPPIHSAGNAVHWTSDSSEFFYIGLSGDPQAFDNELFKFDVAAGRADRMRVPWVSGQEFRCVHVFDDVVIASEGFSAPRPVAIAEKSRGEWRWRSFLTEVYAATFGQLVDRDYVAVTFEACNNGRVVGINIDSPRVNEPSSWRVILPESDGVMVSLMAVHDSLYVHEVIGGRSRLRLIAPDGRDNLVPLPADGLLETGATALYSISDNRSSKFETTLFGADCEATALTHDPHSLAGPHFHVAHDTSDLMIVHDEVPASDGRRIQLTRLRHRGLDQTAAHPVLLYSYGGFNLNTSALVSGSIMELQAFARLGGEAFVAHIRGDADQGKSWWQEGRLGRKQRCHVDVIEVAEWLIDASQTSSRQLALVGHSNGGLTSVNAAIQRPDLWAAVVSVAGWVDPVGGVRFPFLRLCASLELGDFDRVADVERMLALSPIHQLEDNQNLPPIYLDVGLNDTRVPAYMSAKLFAAIARAVGQDRALLVRWENSGHGAYDGDEVADRRAACWLSFVTSHLGMAASSPTHF